MDTDCIFCKIVTGDISCFKIFETENFIAFLDILHFTPGHTLVIPKVHYQYVWDIPNIDEYYDVIKKIAQHYRLNLNFKYVDSLIFGRMIPHAHVHLLPHNGDVVEWENALKGLEYFYQDTKRKLSPETGNLLVQKFKLS